MDDTTALTEELETVHASRGLRVNLLPRAVRASRIWRRAIRDAIILVGLAALLVAGAATALFVWQTSLDREHQEALDKRTSLLAEQRQYAEIARVLADTQRIETTLGELFADEASASELIALVREAFPEGTSLTGVNITVTGADAESSSAPGGPAAALDESEDAAIGQLELRGTAANQAQVERIEANLAATEGFQVPYLVSARALDGGGEAFTIRVAVTEVLATDRFGQGGDE